MVVVVFDGGCKVSSSRRSHDRSAMKGGEEKRDGDWGGGSSSKRGDKEGWSEARMRQRQA